MDNFPLRLILLQKSQTILRLCSRNIKSCLICNLVEVFITETMKKEYKTRISEDVLQFLLYLLQMLDNIVVHVLTFNTIVQLLNVAFEVGVDALLNAM